MDCKYGLPSNILHAPFFFFRILGDKYINGEIIPCQYPTYQPKQARGSKYKSKAYVRQRDGPPAEKPKTKSST